METDYLNLCCVGIILRQCEQHSNLWNGSFRIAVAGSFGTCPNWAKLLFSIFRNTEFFAQLAELFLLNSAPPERIFGYMCKSFFWLYISQTKISLWLYVIYFYYYVMWRMLVTVSFLNLFSQGDSWTKYLFRIIWKFVKKFEIFKRK